MVTIVWEQKNFPKWIFFYKDLVREDLYDWNFEFEVFCYIGILVIIGGHRLEMWFSRRVFDAYAFFYFVGLLDFLPVVKYLHF